MYSYKHVADAIRTARKAMCMTQVQLAEACNMHIAFITRLEGSADKNVTLNTLAKVAAGMGLRLDIQLTEEPYEKRSFLEPEIEDLLEKTVKHEAKRMAQQVTEAAKDPAYREGKWSGRYTRRVIEDANGETSIAFDFDVTDDELMDAFMNGEFT